MIRSVRPHLAAVAGYVPGEQPRGATYIKLNTNENPYAPSPHVAEAITRGLDGRLRRYPDPVGQALRDAAGRLHGVDPAMILAGNGSDDLLTILTRACVDAGQPVLYPTPSYVLYRTLCELQDARGLAVPFRDDWTLDTTAFRHPRAQLAFLANPNSPSGTRLTPEQVAALAAGLDCLLVVDEAYADFADGNCLPLLKTHPNVVILRTLSKGYGLAGLRLGYLIAQAEVVAQLMKVKDSYNCDELSLLGAVAALEDQEHLNSTRGRIIATRARLTATLRERGFEVTPSQANFVWCPVGPRAVPLYEALKAGGILVRLMRYEGFPEGLRITVGTDAEIDQFLATIDTLR